MKPTHVLPDDPALPGLVAIRAAGLASAIPALGADPIDIRLIGYSRGQRATLEARTGGRRFAVKCYAKSPADEASVYQALAAAGLTAAGSPVRVPQLMALEMDLRVIVIDWLEGPSARDLLARARGDRAGELAASWLRCSASLDVTIGPALAAEGSLSRAREWAAALAAADPSLGSAAATLAARMSGAVPSDGEARLVHGRLYIRHLIDIGRACGLIDWERFGRGPLELDAGMFLASLWRSGQKEELAREAARAEEVFRDATAGLLDAHRLAWYRAGALLCLANHQLARGGSDCLTRARAMVREALRGLEAGSESPAGRGAHEVAPAFPAVRSEGSSRPRAGVGPAGELLGAHVGGTAADHDEAAPCAGAAASGTRLWLHALGAHSDEIEGATASSATGLAFALMRVLWERGEATAREVSERLVPRPARATVTTLLRWLEKRGVVSHRLAGRQLVYRAAVDRERLQRSFVEDFASFADELFDGDRAALVCHLIGARDVDAKDLARAVELLRARERETEAGRT